MGWLRRAWFSIELGADRASVRLVLILEITDIRIE